MKITKLKKLKEKYNNSFNEINIIDFGLYDDIKIYYRAKFCDDISGMNYNDDGYKFYYTGDDFDDMDCYGGEFYFDSIEEIIDLIPEAKKYHKKTTHVFIHREVMFLNTPNSLENDQMLMEIGCICIPTDDL